METADHLFGACPAMIQIWKRLSVATSSRISIMNLEELWAHMVEAPNLGKEAVRVAVARIILPAAVWATWVTRNGVLFRQNRFYIENLWDTTVGFIKDWGCSLAGARRVFLLSEKLVIEM
ncbi:hypothetical protein QJS10_CPB13g01293 [Acorus calamus]|uniref:Reverse transcriptase zinc-binding domain-containing protein n=1 Tax=Acorus calamus TaxID=4465 RepID=A0AAV9DIV5_ACOCL|nr:hypothetical protein QJS10_CPB13g01293 [Acorus calamus]